MVLVMVNRVLLCRIFLVLTACLASVSALADTLTLANGDTLTGTIVEQNEDAVVLDHPTLGRLILQVAQLAPPVEEELLAMAEEPLVKKETRIEAGTNGARGNSHNSEYHLGLDYRREDPEERRHFHTAHHKKSTDGDTEENDFYAELTEDWLIPDSPWFDFARGRYDWDDFEDWESRVSLSGGLGYQFYDSKTFDLAGRFGVGASQTYGGNDDKLEPEGLLGLDGRWQLNGSQSLEFETTFYPSLEDVGEFRNISTLGWLLDIDRDSGLRLKLGIINEHESDPEGDSKSNDFKYDLSLQWLL